MPTHGLKIVLLATLGMRLLYLLESTDHPSFFDPIIDSYTYLQRGQFLATHMSLSPDLFWQPVFYPVFLSLFQFLSPNAAIIAIKVAQALLATLSVYVLYELSKKIWDQRLALLAGLLYAFYVPLIFFEGELLATAWAGFWLVFLTWAFLSERMAQPGFSALVGFCAGLAVITRTTFFPMVALAGFFLARATFKSPRLPKLAAYYLTLGFVLLVTASLSYRATGDFSFLTSARGLNAYIFMNPDYCARVNIRPGFAWKKLTRQADLAGHRQTPERIAFYQNRLLAEIQEKPLEFLKASSGKILRFFNSREIPRNLDIYTYGEWSKIIRPGVWRLGAFGFPFGLVLLFALIGLVLAWDSIPLLFRYNLISYSLSVMLVATAARYRMPVLPLLLILAALGLRCCIARTKAKTWNGRSLGVLTVLLLLFTACQIPRFCEEGVNPGQEGVHYASELFYCLGTNGDERDDPGAAICSYQEALKRDPGNLQAYHHLGKALSRRGDRAGAKDAFKQGLQHGRHPQLLGSLGLALSQEGQFREARILLEEAILLEPEHEAALIDLGNLHLQERDFPAAISRYQEALAINPFSEVAHNHLGVAYASSQQIQLAEESFRTAIKLHPDYREAYFNLGVNLMFQGQLTEAAEAFERTIQFEPGLAEAHENLGHIYERLGQVERSEAHRKKAQELGRP